MDIKFHGKIHFNRTRSNNNLNMHCHLIVSRKDQANKKKLSPLTNHKNTKNGIIKGGFNRVNLFRQAEQGFDKLFDYSRQQSESFDYHNTMKNNTITVQLKLQKLRIQPNERKTEINRGSTLEKILAINIENKEIYNLISNTNTHISTKQEDSTIINPCFNQRNKQRSNSFSSIVSSCTNLSSDQEEQIPKPKKTKKKKRTL